MFVGEAVALPPTHVALEWLSNTLSINGARGVHRKKRPDHFVKQFGVGIVNGKEAEASLKSVDIMDPVAYIFDGEGRVILLWLLLRHGL